MVDRENHRREDALSYVFQYSRDLAGRVPMERTFWAKHRGNSWI